jgi:hypothetical protein
VTAGNPSPIRKSRPAGRSGDASPPAAATVSWSAPRILERRLPRLEHLRWMYRLAWAVPGSQVTDKNPAVRLDAWIGLAVTGQPIGLWSLRTGAPEASATGRNRNPEPAHGLLTRPSTRAGTARDSYRWGRGEGPSREACTEPDEHLGMALQRLITQRRLGHAGLAMGRRLRSVGGRGSRRGAGRTPRVGAGVPAA